MTAKISLHLCILWEDELRAAARALYAMKEANKDDFPDKARDALNACLVALHGLKDDRVAVMLGASEVRSQVAVRK